MAKPIFHPDNDTGQIISTTETNAPAGLQRQRLWEWLLFAALAAFYIVVVLIHALQYAPGGGSHFVYLANGWLHGHLYIEGTPPDLSDYTLYKGHWYVAFPPLPAILMLPLVAIFQLSYQAVITLTFSLGMGILNIALMLWVLRRFVHYCAVEAPEALRTHYSFGTLAFLLVFFALGTEHLYATMQGNVWYLAHVVATTFLLLYIGETLGKRRPWLAGIFLGLAALSRSTTLFAFPFYLLLVFVHERRQPRVMWRQWIIFGAMLALFLLGMLLYNEARFGSFLDFGYSTMNVNPLVRNDLHTFGQFNKHFIRINLPYMFWNPPVLLKTFPYVSFNPFGTGIFWTMPALLFAFLSFRYRERRWLAAALLSACILPIILLLMYFNTGWYQFGYRFAMDFLPFALLLAALGMRGRIGWFERSLILLAVLVNVWGYYVFAYHRPPLLGF